VGRVPQIEQNMCGLQPRSDGYSQIEALLDPVEPARQRIFKLLVSVR
jgi:hypothetical protein